MASRQGLWFIPRATPYAFPLTNPRHSLLSWTILLGCLTFRWTNHRPFGILSIPLIPSNPLRLPICTALTPELSFSFHNIVCLPYIITDTSNVSSKTQAHLSCKSLTLTRDLLAPATLLPLATFLHHSAPSVPDSSKTHPNYLNLETCSKRISST